MAELATKTNAHLVIAGEFDRSRDGIRLTPDLYLPATSVPDAEELSGRLALPQLTVPSEQASLPTARLELRNAIASDAATLTHFIIGLGFYLQHNLTAAVTELQLARPSSERDSFRWPLIQLFLGNVEVQGGNYNSARDHYLKAIGDGSEARGRLGLAQVTYQQSRGDCSRGTIDTPGLTRAHRAFTELRHDQTIAASTTLRARVSYAVGQTLVCLSQAEVLDGWSEAEGEFDSVIRTYTRGEVKIRNLAAESWAGLALVYSPVPTATASARRESYQKVTAAYEQALRLTDDPRRRALYRTLLDNARQYG